MTRGENDAAFAEIMYARQESGRPVSEDDQARCFHPGKGMFAALVGAAPFVAFTIAYAVIARPITYTLGVLPSWTEALMRQSEFGDALRYYETVGTLGTLDILRVIDRAMIMPFINVFSYMGKRRGAAGRAAEPPVRAAGASGLRRGLYPGQGLARQDQHRNQNGR